MRGLVGECIKRFEQCGLKIVGMKMAQADNKLAGRHYGEDIANRHGENVRKALLEYIKMGPVVAMVIEGNHAIEIVRKIVGTTEPRTAPAGTLRGDFSIDSYELGDNLKRPVKNLTHASGNKKEAENEISIWFSEEEIYEYKRSDEGALFHKTW
jgi:nucleoside-diphosphate kinase